MERLGSIGLRLAFTDTERQAFAMTPVVESTIPLFCFPTPTKNDELTLASIKRYSDLKDTLHLRIFDHPWYQTEAFMANPCQPGLHILTMGVIPDSLGQMWNYYSSLDSRGVKLPSAVEVVLMLFLHYLGSGEQLFTKKHTWCADTASLDRQVTVGAFGRNGVFLSGHPRNYASRGLGFCGKLK